MELKYEMARKNIKIKDIAKALNITMGTASLKVNGKSIISVNEAQTIRDTFFPEKTLDDLFISANTST